MMNESESGGYQHEPSQQASTTRWVQLGLVLLVLVVYGQVVGHEFIMLDDNDYVYENSYVRRGLSWSGVQWAFTHSHVGHWHPLTWISLMLDAQIYGQPLAAHSRPAGGFHLTNVILHAANVLLLLTVLRRMTGALWPSAMVAALFAVHPLHVESVAWVTSRKDVLSTLFWMLALLTYRSYTEHGDAKKYRLVVFCMVLGLLAKPMLVTLPFVLLLLDYWPLGRLRARHGRRRVGQVLLEKLPLLGLSAAWCLIALMSQRSVGALHGLDAVPITTRLVISLLAYVGYLGKMIWPTGLACVYPHPAHLSANLPGFSVAAAIAAGLLLVVITCLVVFSARRHPYAPVGWFWYLGTLVPVIGLVQVGIQSMADRFTYVPLLGIYILVVWGAADLVQRWSQARTIVAVLSVVVLVALTILAWFQVGLWRNSLVLYEHTLGVTTHNFLIYNQRGIIFTEKGKYDLALNDYARAIEAYPNYADAYSNRGIIHAKMGDYALSMADFDEAIKIKHDYVDAFNNRGALHQRFGKLESALADFDKAIQLRPKHAESYSSRGMAYAQMGNYELALTDFVRAKEKKPHDARLYSTLAWLLATCNDSAIRDGRRAVSIAQRACELSGWSNFSTLGILAAAHAEAGEFAEAARWQVRAVELAPPGAKKELQRRLKLYRAGTPCRFEWETVGK